MRMRLSTCVCVCKYMYTRAFMSSLLILVCGCVSVCVCLHASAYAYVYELSPRSSVPVGRGDVVADDVWRVFLCPMRMRLSILGRLRMRLVYFLRMRMRMRMRLRLSILGRPCMRMRMRMRLSTCVCLHASAYASVYSQPALTGVTANLCCRVCGCTVGYVERRICDGRRHHDDCLGRHALLSLQGFSIFKFRVYCLYSATTFTLL